MGREQAEKTRADLKALIQRNCIVHSDTTIKLHSGGTTTTYFNLKPVLFDSRGRRLIADVLYNHLFSAGRPCFPSDHYITAVGGPAIGAIPIVGTLLDHTAISRGFYIRTEPKPHGLGAQIEGRLEDGDRVLLVDDVNTTGKSLLHCVDTLVKSQYSITIIRIIVIIDRSSGSYVFHPKERFAEAAPTIPIEHLFTADELLEGSK